MSNGNKIVDNYRKILIEVLTKVDLQKFTRFTDKVNFDESNFTYFLEENPKTTFRQYYLSNIDLQNLGK